MNWDYLFFNYLMNIPVIIYFDFKVFNMKIIINVKIIQILIIVKFLFMISP